MIFADFDGVVVIAASEAARVMATAHEIASREQQQASRLLGGERLRDQLRLHDYVARRAADSSHTFRDHLRAIGAAIES
jgi:regulator of RNase E activity RraA